MHCRHSCSSCSSAWISLRDLAQPDFFGRRVVVDYLLEKDPIFAQLTLSMTSTNFTGRSTSACRRRHRRPIS